METVVRLHKETANGFLDELKGLASSNACCVEEGDAYIVGQSKEQGVPSRRQCIHDCSTIETTSTNNVGPVDLSSLGGCLPDANVTGDCSSKTTTFMEDVNVPTVSSANNCMPRADVTVFIVKKDNVTPPNSLQRKTGFGIVTSWREEDLIREMDLYMPIYQCRLHTF
ncbi:hypothetical protein Tco_0889883, partial [Tanacetum coccineum]